MSTRVATPLTATATVAATRVVVPWRTVLTMGAVLAFTSGFWITSLREAVGSIERTSEPFAAWLRESSLLVPFYALAVLAALAVARRRFGTALRGRTLLAGALLVVGFVTVAGVVELAVSSFYDYRLQVVHLDQMGSMGGRCLEACVDGHREATLVLQLKSVGLGSVLLLLSNLVFVGWMLAFLGGRLPVERAAQPRPERSHDRDRQVVVAATLVGSALIHLAVVPEHLAEWQAAGFFFVLLALAQLALADLVMTSPRRTVLLATVGLTAATLGLWAWSRLVGLPFGPEAGETEVVGLADVSAGMLELVTLVAAAALLRSRAPAPRPSLSEHARGLAVLAVVAVTAMGVGAGLSMYGAAGEAHGHAETAEAGA